MENNILVRIGADISNLTSSLRNARSQLTNFSSETQKTFSSLGKIGAGMTVAGVGIAGGLGLAVKTAADFESGMSRVGALSGASDKELAQLTDTAKELGAKTSFSASQAAEGMQYLAMAGYKTSDIIKTMPGLLSAAAAGQTDLATTSDIVSNVLSGFGMKAKDTSKVADVLTKTFTNSNTDLSMLGQTMKYVAPIAHASGQSLESMAAASGILGNAGIQADQAGTSLRMMLIRLAKPPKMAADELKKLGINVSDSHGKMKPLSTIIGELSKKTAGMTQAEKVATVSKIAGTEASSAMLALMDAGQGTIDKFTKSLENSGGAADDIAKKQLDNLNGQFTILKSALEGAAISVGNALLPAIKKIASFAQGLVDKFNGLSDGAKQFIAIGGALTGLFLLFAGPMLIIVGMIPSIVGGFTAIGTAVSWLIGAMAGTLGVVLLVIGVIAAIGVALYFAYQKVGWFRDMVNEAWGMIKNAFFTALTFIKGIVTTVISAVSSFIGEQLDKIKKFWTDNGEQIKQAAKNIFDFIVGIIKGAMGIIKGVIQVVWPIITGIIQVAWGVIKGIISTGVDVILGIIKFFASVFTGDWKGALNAVMGIAKDIWHGITGIFKGIDLVGIGKNIIKGLINGLTSMMGGVTTIVKKVASLIPDGIKKFLGIHSPSRVTFALGSYTGEGLVNGIRKQLSAVKSAAAQMASAAVPNMPSALVTSVGVQAHNIPALDSINVAGSGSKTAPTQITAVIQLDSYEVGRATAPVIDALQTNAITLKTYMSGNKG